MVNMTSPIEQILKGRHLYLASASPRRRQLMSNLGYEVRLIEPREVDESFPTGMPVDDAPVYISRKKAEAYCDVITPDMIVVTADTVVIADNKLLGKPHSPEDAVKMLETLSGKRHRVITGVTLTTFDKIHSFKTVTEVDFDTLTTQEIAYYIDEFKPFDKAGAYGIQEWIGYVGIRGISGDYYNVMGLPVHDLYKHLCQI
ncbi:MAG: Maf family nucleotide pyrophosphatase [Muribaculaceae bacterium]|nr:Maf family nucleotide pyrophosphatase [Muribaculaceae bacterium]